MKKYKMNEIRVNNIAIEIISDNDWQNTFVINGTPGNGFESVADLPCVLSDSLALEEVSVDQSSFKSLVNVVLKKIVQI